MEEDWAQAEALGPDAVGVLGSGFFAQPCAVHCFYVVFFVDFFNYFFAYLFVYVVEVGSFFCLFFPYRVGAFVECV